MTARAIENDKMRFPVAGWSASGIIDHNKRFWQTEKEINELIYEFFLFPCAEYIPIFFYEQA